MEPLLAAQYFILAALTTHFLAALTTHFRARGRHVKTVIGICAASDVLLIAAGVAGMGTVIRTDPSLLMVVRVFGGALLLVYTGLAACSASSSSCQLRPGGGWWRIAVLQQLLQPS
jgi:arginine exporter protein ArgO